MKKMLWSNVMQPSLSMLESPLWRNEGGRGGVFGDSNGHYTDAHSMISSDCSNYALGGSTPYHTFNVLSTLPYEYIDNLKKIYIQTGANMWGGIPCSVLELDISPYLQIMEKIIRRAKLITEAKNIVIASLPFVAPWITIKDWPTTSQYPELLRKQLENIHANDLHELANTHLKDMCVREGVLYYDIFSFLKVYWNGGFKEGLFCNIQHFWWDTVHYDSRIRIAQGREIRRMWGG